MNLSNSVQLPASSSTPQTTGTAAASKASSAVGVGADGKMKLDFTNIMARQFEQLPALKRQDLAALKHLDASSDEDDQDASEREETVISDGNTPPADDTSRLSQDAARQPVDTQSHFQSQRNLTRQDQDSHGNTDERRSSDESTAQDSADSGSSTGTRRSARHANATTASSTDTANLTLAWLNPLQAAVVPTAPSPTTALTSSVAGIASVSATAVAGNTAGLSGTGISTGDASVGTTLPDGTALRAVALSPQIQIITDPRNAPSTESLTAFAQSMGMDPQSIRQLVGGNGTGTTPTDTAQASAGQTSADAPLNTQLTAQGNANLASQLGATLPATSGMGADAASALNTLTAQIATQLQARAAVSPSQASQLPAPAAPAAAQALTANDPNMAANTALALQTGMLPAAPVQTAVTTATTTATTSDSADDLGVSLNSADLSGLTALASGIGASDGANLSQDGGAQSGSGNGGQSGANAFGQQTQSLATNKLSSDTGNNVKASDVDSAQADRYQKLSDKLSTEMANRINQQLNAGQWKMKFGLRPAHLGGVEVQLEMKDGKLNTQINADNPMTRELLQNGSQRLRESLANFGIQTDQVSVGQNGTSGQQTTSNGGSGGNRAQVGDNLTPSTGSDSGSVEAATAPGNSTSSDALLDLYA